MRPDVDIKRDVEQELRYNPDIDAGDIGIAVRGGIVTLTGFVRSYAQKWEAEQSVKRVAGTVGVANDLDVRLPILNQRPDPEIARDAVAAIQKELPYSGQHMHVLVREGWITLEGQVEWNYVRERAEQAVRRVRGVRGITNLIALAPTAAPSDIRGRIEDAFRRSAELDAGRITVEASGDVVVLKGTVHTWAERQEAERVAWQAPGVTKVENQIVVSP